VIGQEGDRKIMVEVTWSRWEYETHVGKREEEM
jgi:hypothetical protein